MKSVAISARFAVLTCCALVGVARAQTVEPPFSTFYTAINLGSVPGLPAPFGGLTFLNNNTLLIGGSASTIAGRLYTVGVVRGAGNHITGFSGSATQYGTGIGEYNAGGVVFGPGGVLFTSRDVVIELGQTRPGSLDEDRIIDLAPLGVAFAHVALNFVPTGFGGAGRIKLVSFNGGLWYSATLSPDGTGTFDLTGVTRIDLDPITPGIQDLPGGAYGFAYIAAGNPQFTLNSLLLAEFNALQVAAYDLDSNGDPLVATRRLFVSGVSTRPEGATIDPVTGDFVYSSYNNHVVVVRGFIAPPDLGVSPPSLAFGNQVVGTSSATQNITLTNTGGTTLAIASIVASGDFARTTTCGATLAASASCTVSVTFTPTMLGPRTGAVTITSNAPGSPHTASLSGTGIAAGGPAVSLSPPSLAFAGQIVGTTSVPQTITLTNTGGTTLNITSIIASGDFARTTTCGATLAPSGSCAINVTFTPTLLGARSGAITIISNAAGSPHTVGLAGIGIAAAQAESIPTLSEWGLLAMGLLLAAVGVEVFRRWLV